MYGPDWLDSRLSLNLYQYTSSSDCSAYCYAELAVLSVTGTIASVHCAYPQRDGQAETEINCSLFIYLLNLTQVQYK